MIARHLHLDHADVVLIDQCRQFLKVVVVEREDGTLEVAWYAVGRETR